MSSSAEQPALYPLIHWNLGKAVPPWLYPSLRKNGLISADLGEFWPGNQNLTQRSVPNPDLPFQQVRPVFSPLWGFLQDNKQKIKGFEVWSQADSVKWAHKTGPKPLFSTGRRIFTVTVLQPSQAQIMRENCWRKGTFYQQPFQWPYFGTSEFFHHEEGIISFVIVVIVIIGRGGSFCPLPGQSSSSSGIKGIYHDGLGAFDLTATERTTLAFWFLQGTQEICHCSLWGAQIITCLRNRVSF